MSQHNHPEAVDKEEDDLQFAAVADSLEKSFSSSGNFNPPTKPSNKRKFSTEKTDDPAEKRSRSEFCSALLQQVKTIDPKKELSIHHFLNDLKTDPIVDEYVDLLIKLGFVPSSPSSEQISFYGMMREKPPLTINTSIKCMHLLMTYFQLRYFHTNLQGANQKTKAVIAIQAKLSIPNFKDLPIQILNKMTEDKRACAISLQENAMQGSSFMCELLKLRTGSLIREEVKGSSNDQVLVGTEIQSYFNYHFTKAKTEFMKEYPAKDINWEMYQDKIRHVEPSWRYKDTPIPITRNMYANEIEHKLSSGKETMNPKTVGEDYELFLNSTEPVGNRHTIKRRTTTGSRQNTKNKFHRIPQWSYPGTSQVNPWNPPPPPPLPNQYYPFPLSQIGNVTGNGRNIHAAHKTGRRSYQAHHRTTNGTFFNGNPVPPPTHPPQNQSQRNRNANRFAAPFKPPGQRNTLRPNNTFSVQQTSTDFSPEHQGHQSSSSQSTSTAPTTHSKNFKTGTVNKTNLTTSLD